MKRPNLLSNKQFRTIYGVLFISTVVIGLALLVVCSMRNENVNAKVEVEASHTLITPPPLQDNTKRVNIVPVTLREWGFDEKELKLQYKEFTLVINNLSQLTEDLTFVLSDEAGQVVKEAKANHRASKRLYIPLNLNLGKYILKVNGHEQWKSEVIISEE